MDSSTTGQTITDAAEPEEIVTMIARSASHDDLELLLTVGAETTPLPDGWRALKRQLVSDAKGVRWVTLAWARSPAALEGATLQHPTAETLLALRRQTNPGAETPWTMLGHMTAIGEHDMTVILGPSGAPYEWTVQHEDDPSAFVEGAAPTVELAKAAALAVARGPHAPGPVGDEAPDEIG